MIDVIYRLAPAEPFWLHHTRGWRILLDSFSLPAVARPYRMMGLEVDKENTDQAILRKGDCPFSILML